MKTRKRAARLLALLLTLASCAPSAPQVDLLLGTWAEKNVAGLSGSEMDSYEDILNLETVDIFNFIAGNAEPPAFVDTPMMARLQVFTSELCGFERDYCCGLKGTATYPTYGCLYVVVSSR